MAARNPVRHSGGLATLQSANMSSIDDEMDAASVDDVGIDVNATARRFRRRQRIGAMIGVLALCCVAAGVGVAIFLSNRSKPTTIQLPKVRGSVGDEACRLFVCVCV